MLSWDCLLSNPTHAILARIIETGRVGIESFGFPSLDSASAATNISDEVVAELFPSPSSVARSWQSQSLSLGDAGGSSPTRANLSNVGRMSELKAVGAHIATSILDTIKKLPPSERVAACEREMSAANGEHRCC